MAGQNNGKQGGQQQDVNQLLKVRREKLANLQEAGQDPFQITKYDVTHHIRCEGTLQCTRREAFSRQTGS